MKNEQEVEWATFDTIESHEFRGYHYKAYKHDFFRHANEAESRIRHLKVAKDEVMIDVGAACGTWTIPGAYLAKQVYSLEPFSWMANELRKNIDLNNIKNVVILQAMGWDHTGSREMASCTGAPDGTSNIAYSGDTQLLALDDLVVAKRIEKVGFI